MGSYLCSSFFCDRNYVNRRTNRARCTINKEILIDSMRKEFLERAVVELVSKCGAVSVNHFLLFQSSGGSRICERGVHKCPC